LDEATASVDHATDEKIQTTLRSEFNESTLITIAHRLRTIMDYDKILVLNEGRLVEYVRFLFPRLISRFDTPSNLLEKKGLFYNMVVESGEFETLAAIARGSH